jgi:hypothetical protein
MFREGPDWLLLFAFWDLKSAQRNVLELGHSEEASCGADRFILVAVCGSRLPLGAT